MSNYKKRIALVLAGVMAFSTAFTGYYAEADANTDTYLTDADLADNGTAAPAADEVIPNANQYRYQKEELSAFCHFGPNTFNEIEWGESYGDRTPSSIFTLTQNFDADTLVSTLKEAGFEKLVVTAKHHDGFCIWNSAYTEYDVESTTYATYNYDGMGGDILAEISAACTEHDMDMGLYLSPWDIHDDSYGYYDANGNATNAAGDVLDYNDYYNNQLDEILGNDKYGNDGHFNEVWMDGAKGSGANAQEYDFVRWFETIQSHEGKAAGYDADCMLFGAEAYTTVRWIGNENGLSGEQTWSKSVANMTANTVDHNRVEADHFNYGYSNGNIWTVPEADARITSGWFWGTAKCTPKTITDLANMYFNSVGHNSVLLLNVPPNNRGTVDDAILARVEEFGNEVRETFATNLAADAAISASAVRGSDIAYKPSNVIDGDDATYWTTEDGTTTGSLVVDFGETKVFDVVSIEEAIQFGQRIKSFTVEYRNGADSEWKVFDEGTTVGSKRLSRDAAVKADQVKITVSTEATNATYVSTSSLAAEAATGVPMISEVGVYKASEGFEAVGVAPLGMTVIDERDDEFTFSGTWTNGAGSAFIINQTEKWANSGNSFTINFTGSKLYLIGTIDPGHGTANISIDGGAATSINTTGASRKTGQIIYETGDLADGEHTLTLTTTGTIGVDGAYVINNGGLGMIGIEEAAYTMDEDSEMEVTLVRVGGTTEEDVTVTLAPNPGTAIQDDFDTELIETVTFAAGETEKTATVRTTRNTNKTGNQYFTIELEAANEELILGFNDKATVTIRDTESIGSTYSEANRFEFPAKGDTATLEAELMVLNNSGTNETWPMQVAEKDWASNGKIINAMNSGDSAVLYYNAPKAGTYAATVTYRSGSSSNGFSWSEANGKITAGSVTMGANDSAAANHTGTVTFEVVTAGEGALTLTAASAGAPQLDKFDITYVDAADDSMDYTGTVTYTAGSVEEREGVEGPIALAFDGQTNTYWHSEWSPSWSTSQIEDYLWVEFELEGPTMVDAIRYLPRPAGSRNGDITGYRVEGTTDGETWTTLTTGTWTRDGQNWKIAEFEPTEVVGLKLVATSTYADSGNNKFASAAELRIRTYEEPAFTYTAEDPFVLPSELNASATLEAEHMIINNSGTGEPWPMQVTAKDWASNGKILNAMNNGDSATLYYNAPVAGTYTVTLTFRSGAASNGFSWSEADGKITAGNVTAGASDGASANHTGTLTLEVVEAGAGVLTLTAASAGAPQMDKFDVVLTAVPEVEEPDPTPDPTPDPEPDPEPEPKEEVCKVFSDVAHGQWYEAAVQYVYDNGIMSGNSGLFNPTGNITRAQVVTTLYNLEGRPAVTDKSAVNDLTDVLDGQWYTDAVCWAYSVKVASGNSTTKMFNMNTPVTRQQLATFFYKYAEYKGFDITTREDISDMVGADQVADYALDTMKWAVGTGLITGSASKDANGNTVYDLKPTGTATRAQMASILQRFCEGNNI